MMSKAKARAAAAADRVADKARDARAALDASHGSSSTRDTTSATEPKSVTELGTAADALEVTLSIASRSAEPCSSGRWFIHQGA